MINKKTLGILIIIASLIFLASTIIFVIQIDQLHLELTKLNGGTCFIKGNCIYNQKNNFPTYLGAIAILLNIILGISFVFSSKKELEIKEYIEEDKAERENGKKFEFLLKGLDEYERKVIKTVKEQDGISQSTLRIRTDMSKAKLSMVLSNLEKKNLIKKVQQGKFNKIFLKTAL